MQKLKTSNFQGCIYALDIITAWQKQIISTNNSNPFSQIGLLIMDDDQNNEPQKLFAKAKRIIIIKLKQTKLHPVHILSLSGQLKLFGQNQSQPFFPENLVQITAANAIAIICFLILENLQNNPQRIIEKSLSLVQCMKYFGVFNVLSSELGMIDKTNLRGKNLLDGGLASYGLFNCKGNSILAVGNIQYKFYQQMLSELPLAHKQSFCQQNHMNNEAWPKISQILRQIFQEDTAENWEVKMSKRDTCITAVRQPQYMGKNYLHPKLMKPKL